MVVKRVTCGGQAGAGGEAEPCRKPHRFRSGTLRGAPERRHRGARLQRHGLEDCGAQTASPSWQPRGGDLLP